MLQTARRTVGAVILDVPPALSALQKGEWVRLRNRADVTTQIDVPLATRVLSDKTSTLHVCDVFPGIGARLLRVAARQWSFSSAAEVSFSENPDVSFIIPFRGEDRTEQLHAVIRSIAGSGAGVECIVVEQDESRRLESLPGNTRYLHLPHPKGDTRWHKCFAMNEGARHAKGRILVFHDGDLVVPNRYLEELRRLFDVAGNDVAFPQRFLFYLDALASRSIQMARGHCELSTIVPARITQNWVGGTVAIRSEAFWAIGGFDERFVGWGGEDLEFYDRCQTLRGFFHGYLPFLHLWHPYQKGKKNPEARECGDDFTTEVLSVPREDRIRALRSLPQ